MTGTPKPESPARLAIPAGPGADSGPPSGSSPVKFALVDPGSGRRAAWLDDADLVAHLFVPDELCP